jgi:phenylalanyl-tRNA synthetase beta chain
VDFFDAKSDVEAVLALGRGEFRFEAAGHSALHPGQSARILRGDREAGWIGVLHPGLARALDLELAPIVWELDADLALVAELPDFAGVSRFPAIRRDIAVLVEAALPASELLASARSAAGPLLTECKVFDIYTGERIDSGLKSVALGLILQDSSRTLTDQEADRVVGAVVKRLESDFGARMRD